MALGDTCTRACHFCAVRSGRPAPPDPGEPDRIAAAVEDLGLSYVVLTMVTRDDLPDGGADHLARCVERIKARKPSLRVEVLSSDFRGDPAALSRVASCGADVLAHNIETTDALTPAIRDARASYARSLDVLARYKDLAPARLTKSGLSLGLGESEEDVQKACRDLRSVRCDVLTLGQYLRPSPRHAPIAEYVTPQRFDAYRSMAESLGFLHVVSGPLVRSSYRAGESFLKSRLDPSAPPSSQGARDA
jgi:lipoic acid synthetase